MTTTENNRYSQDFQTGSIEDDNGHSRGRHVDRPAGPDGPAGDSPADGGRSGTGTRSGRESLQLDVVSSEVSQREVSTRVAAGGACVAAATFIIGLVLYSTGLSDFTAADASAAELVDFIVGHQTTLTVWYLVIYVVFGIALVPLAVGLRRRLLESSPMLTETATVFGFIWVGLVIAAGTVASVGIETVADLAQRDPGGAADLWSSIDAVTNGLGGGNEIVGAVWILLIGAAGRRGDLLSRPLLIVGTITGVAGVLTVLPGDAVAEVVFGLGSIVWFVWIGVALARSVKTPPALGRLDDNSRHAVSV